MQTTGSIMPTTNNFKELSMDGFITIILDGGERADEAMYYLLHQRFYLPLKKRYEVFQHQLADDFDDILADFFFHLRDGSPLPYPSIHRIKNRDAFPAWLLRTFRNYLSARADKEWATTCVSLNAENVTDTDANANDASSLLTDEQKLSLAAHLIAFAHQEMPPRDNFLLFRALLTILDKQRSLPNEEVAEALGMTDITYRVTVHRVKDRLAQLRTRLLKGEPSHLNEPHQRMAHRINEDFLQLYPTLLYYYKLSIDALDRECSEAVKQLQQSHFAATGQLLHESAVPYEAQHSKARLWNLVGRFLNPE